MKTGTAAVAAMGPALVVGVVTLSTAVQPLGTDLYLAALPAIRNEYAARVGVVQLTLAGAGVQLRAEPTAVEARPPTASAAARCWRRASCCTRPAPPWARWRRTSRC